MSDLIITPSETPNPNARKYTLDRSLGETMLNFNTPEQAAGHVLASQLFKLPGVTNVFMTGNFITVNKLPAIEWGALDTRVTAIIRDHYSEEQS